MSSILKGKSRIYTEKYNKFVEYYGYEVSPCNVARGNEKGHVERDIQTFTHRIRSRLKIEGKVFKNFEELNDWIVETISTMQQGVENEFKVEQLKLNPKRPRREDLESHSVIVTGSKYGTVRFGKSVYSIPDGCIETNMKLTATAYEVKISHIQTGKLIVTHPRLKDNSESILMEHVVHSLLRKPSALLSWKHRGLIFNDSILSLFYSQIKKQDVYNAEKKLLQVLNLIQHTTLNEIKASIELWLENPNKSPYEFIRELIIDERRPETYYHQDKLNPNLEFYDQFLTGGANVLIH